MNSIVKFSLYQFALCCLLIIINIPLDKFVNKPFTFVDFITICMVGLVLIIGYNQVVKIYKRFEHIKTRNKILITIPTAIIGTLFLGFLQQLFFSLFM